ncbi:two-component response regulator [Calothrix sp. NIES-4071]|nr:two-component response regulator [Calothrix sp. NIES-4071]BAZ55483.1 two-component response regulator [Calothrix sp. NIES-4105]
MSKLTLLAVDDNADSLELLKTVLDSSFNVNVLTATSASEAWQILTQVQPDILISDIVMPEEDGFSLINKIRRHQNEKISNISAIAVTALPESELDSFETNNGFNKLIYKPFDFDYLIQHINEMVSPY